MFHLIQYLGLGESMSFAGPAFGQCSRVEQGALRAGPGLPLRFYGLCLVELGAVAR